MTTLLRKKIRRDLLWESKSSGLERLENETGAGAVTFSTSTSTSTVPEAAAGAVV